MPVGTTLVDQLPGSLKLPPADGVIDQTASSCAWADLVVSTAMTIVDISSDMAVRAKERGMKKNGAVCDFSGLMTHSNGAESTVGEDSTVACVSA